MATLWNFHVLVDTGSLVARETLRETQAAGEWRQEKEAPLRHAQGKENQSSGGWSLSRGASASAETKWSPRLSGKAAGGN